MTDKNIEVGTDLLFKDGDACTFIVLSKTVPIPKRLARDQVYNGIILHRHPTNDGYSVQLDLRTEAGEKLIFDIGGLERVMKEVELKVLLTAKETAKRIHDLINEQEVEIQAKYDNDKLNCAKARSFLLTRYNLPEE